MSSFAWTDARVRDALGWLPLDEQPADEYRNVTTDSRSVGEGDLFVALIGDRFDGHDYVAEAVARGATGTVTSRRVDAGDARVYPVGDTQHALGLLARYRRRALAARVVGITGSAGKTTTKDMTRGALASRFRVHATRGNLNNQIGVPLTLLAAPDDTQVVVLEMGTNEPGEIAILAAIAEPEIGVVTTVGETHVEKLGSLHGVLAEKLDLLRALPAQGVALVGDQPADLVDEARTIRSDVRVAGTTPRADADLRPTDLSLDIDGRATFEWRGHRVSLSVPGRHNLSNALLALGVAEVLGVDPAEAAKGVGRVGPAAMRGEIRTVGSLTVIVDCYNANPQSVRAALDLLGDLKTDGGSVAVLGSMLELGDLAPALHEAILAEALSRDLDVIVATGDFAAAARQPVHQSPVSAGRLIVASDPLDAYRALVGRLAAGQTVLLKGSRGVRLERLLEPLARDFGDQGEVA